MGTRAGPAASSTGPAEPAALPPFAFVGQGGCDAVLDRAEHLRRDDAALDALWNEARVLLLDDAGQALVDATQRPALARGAELGRGAGGKGAAVFLGIDSGGQAWFSLDAGLAEFDAPGRIDLRGAAMLWPALEASVFAQARAMQAWRQRHRYCGACGASLAMMRAGWLAHCTGCGVEHYPRTDPAIIAAVTDGERLLLGRQAAWMPRRWSVLAGFVEPGESLEQAVAREVLEETGVRVRECRYLASQPWPFPGALMLGFVARAEADEPCVTGELEAARWFTRAEVRAAEAREITGRDDGGPLLASRISIARWLIEQWLGEPTDGAAVRAR